ncbi:SIMPL domain-containing protein [Luteipulveratus halotolerans]|uniref:DUF541 domain-containing protein n=1 Tax=Luteipulveratus halotolerans TaxID=1631356 RepID=A0A0L6CIW6_9MICO|nr:SIMPL domain-containing protein [Luteipulveratus halotolerans]KNX37679.1 hypothetical protein VV01_11860 [Luteipulveratus halotolerans]
MSAPDHSITVIGGGTAAGSPDVVRLVVAARAEARDVSAALEACQQSARTLTATLRDQGVTDAELRTLGVSVDTRWGPESRPSGYEATHRLGVSWRDPATVGGALKACADAVGNTFRLESLRLTVEDPSALEDQARQAAYDDAHRQAGDLARLAGRELGQVIAIDQPDQRGGPAPMARMAMSAGDGGGVEAGQHSVEVRLRVRWALT